MHVKELTGVVDKTTVFEEINDHFKLEEQNRDCADDLDGALEHYATGSADYTLISVDTFLTEIDLPDNGNGDPEVAEVKSWVEYLRKRFKRLNVELIDLEN